jgi:hypothetical protein
MNLFRIVPVSVLALSGAFVGASPAGATPASPYVCSSGNIPSGTYASVQVTGVCYVPSGTVVINGNLTVAPGALLDATTPEGFLTPSPAALPGIVTVGGNVTVGKGAVLLLGCDSGISCPTATTFGQDSVAGNLTGKGALGVVVHAVTIGGSASLVGGGGGSSQLKGGPGSGNCSNAAVPALWGSDPALANAWGQGVASPVYSDFEDSAIGKNLSIVSLKTCWIGSLRDTVGGNLIDHSNLMGDPDGNEVVNNTVSGNISCHGNDHVVQFGDSGATPNVVSGSAHGECAFTVMQPDENYGSGGPQPISLKASASKTVRRAHVK